MSKANKIVAVTPGGSITEDMILGYISLVSLPEKSVSASRLYREWLGEGLPPQLVPRQRKPVNAFQVACRSVETRKRGSNANGDRVEIEVDPVTETETKVVYQVTSLRRDKTNEIIDHPKALRVSFDKTGETIHWEPLDRLFDPDQANEIGEKIKEYFDSHSGKVPASRVRHAIRQLFDICDATNLRRKGGGVYLVPSEHKHYLDSLRSILDTFWQGEGDVTMIPCANGEAEREMVERHFDVNISEEIDEMMKTAREALTRPDRSIRQDAIGNMLARRKQLGNRRARYSEMLSDDLDTVEEKLSLLDQQLEAVLLAKAGD